MSSIPLDTIIEVAGWRENCRKEQALLDAEARKRARAERRAALAPVLPTLTHHRTSRARPPSS